ncbi:MAG: hypothetical protein BGO95_06105 [Micrococcales bacterium 73-13]|nr:MAG: hypothetical protein BGO95_06105 [Micrococcales bacterium 73-13]
MRLGVFLPTGNNGWIFSANSPQYMPTYALNQSIVRRAEGFGFQLGLEMISFRGYGGATEHWDYTTEPFTLASPILATTRRMQIFASVGVLSLHPAMLARMVATIDDVAPGRLGINITTGWHRAEYAQMGMWPGDDYFGYRYEYATEYTTILKQLLEEGASDFKGRYFELDDCRMGFHPANPVQIVAAGASGRGRRFAAEFADYNFTTAKDPDGMRTAVDELRSATEQTGRDVRLLTARSVILGDTDEDAARLIDHYNAGTDTEALANEQGNYAVDAKGTSSTERAASIQVRQAINPDDAALFAGSPRTVARRLNELAAIDGIDGVLMHFDDFEAGLDRFGVEVIPLLDFDITR